VDAASCLPGPAEIEEHRGNLDAAREHLDCAGELSAATARSSTSTRCW
jgi:hypothetical protein